MGGSGLLASDGRGWNLGVLSALINAFPCSPAPGLPRCTPSLSPRRGRCRGPGQVRRASRLSVQSAQAPRTPRSRAAGSWAAGKRAASGGSVPAQAPLCPGETRVSPATLGCGMAHPRAGGRRRPLGLGRPRQKVGTPSLTPDESLRSASPPFSKKSNSGNVVPYLPAPLPPLTFCTLEVGAEVIMQTSGAVLRRYPAPFLFNLKAALSHLHNNGLSRITL